MRRVPPGAGDWVPCPRRHTSVGMPAGVSGRHCELGLGSGAMPTSQQQRGHAGENVEFKDYQRATT